MNRAELKRAVAIKSEFKQDDVDTVLTAILEVIKEAVSSGDKVQLLGFGSFDVSERAAREGRNPQTGEPLSIPASKGIKFKASAEFKASVNK